MAYPIVSGNGCVIVASDPPFENLLVVVEGLERDTRSQGGIDNGACTGDDDKTVRYSLEIFIRRASIAHVGSRSISPTIPPLAETPVFQAPSSSASSIKSSNPATGGSKAKPGEKAGFVAIQKRE